MTRDELETAGDHLASAADSIGDGDAADRLRDLAGQLDDLAEADEGPDHGRLARIQAAMADVKDEANEDAAAAIDDANDAINEYREDLEGV